MSKEQLETNLAALELLQNETNDKLTDYKAQIVQVKKDIEDLNKPELTPTQLDAIYLAVEKAVEEFDFSDTDNFDIEYGIEYDGKVYCETHEMNDTSKLVDLIGQEVSRIFTEMDAPEDDNS